MSQGTGKKVTFVNQGPKFEISVPLMDMSENRDPNQSTSNYQAMNAQHEQWAEELRRADERCNKFKDDMVKLQEVNTQLE